MLGEHNFVDGTCRYCGAIQNKLSANEERTCITHKSKAAAEPRPRPPSALDDNDAIHTRLRELQAEREAIEAGRKE